MISQVVWMSRRMTRVCPMVDDECLEIGLIGRPGIVCWWLAHAILVSVWPSHERL